MSDDPLENALALGAAGAMGAILGFLFGAATVIAALWWYLS